MFSVDGENVAWGNNLEPVEPKYISIVHKDTTKIHASEENPLVASSPEHLDSVIEIFSMHKNKMLKDIRNKALADIDKITENIEKDIDYFNTLGGLGIAMNKLAFIKQNLQDIKKDLGRI